MIKQVDPSIIEKLPPAVRKQLKAADRPRKMEKEIMEILQVAQDAVTLDYMIVHLWTDFKIQVKRGSLVAALVRLVNDQRLERLPGKGKQNIFRIHPDRHRQEERGKKRSTPVEGSAHRRGIKDA